MDWQLHWLEAEGEIAPWRDRIAAEIDETRQSIARVLPPPRLDILIQCLPNAVIPEIGMVGRAYRKSLVALTLDPDNSLLESSLVEGTLRRQVAHEVHHCLRMASVGYGRTLGEALVSEGLAGRFVGHLFGTLPEPWERAVDDETLNAHLPTADEVAAPSYDHGSWFFGAGGRRPRWLGYTLGYRMVGEWQAAMPRIDGAEWVDTPAATILATARGHILSKRR